ncbi:MAG: energy transducer TonB, partial [Candidatus Marinimicrobia bacterium]|nr:energy transducer TonB [Candidatus Neomarinimicrobiota bacterium]
MKDDKFILRYPVRVRWVLVTVIVFVVFIFYLIPRFEQELTYVQTTIMEEIETFDIPPTEIFEAPPPPSRPAIPVESEDEDIAEDITIEETDLDDFEWEAPPPPPDQGPTVRFIPYDEAPEPIGGYEAIQRNVRYPEIAQEAGIEGMIIVQAFINDKGRVEETVILKGIPNTG